MSAPRYEHRPGERIGRWALVEPLGRGGFSEVWRARLAPPCEPLPGLGAGTDIALKLLVHEEHVAELRKEASALALVRGEGIVRTFEADLESDPPFIALALLEGGDMRKHMLAEGGRLHPSKALLIIEHILEILARVHREGIVHGDLKPENVLADARGFVHLADFGLSRRIAQRSATLSVSLSLADARIAGTLEYMAPEQRDGAKPTPRCDVYAVGVMLHELVTGERPQGVSGLPGEKDPSLPPLVDRTLAGALALDPRERFEDAAGMLKFLRLGLWNDGQLLRSSLLGTNDRKIIAADYGIAWLGTIGFLGMISINELRKDVPTALAISAALLVAVLPIALVAPWLSRWNRKLGRDLKRIEVQLEVLRGWREPDQIRAIEAITTTVVPRRRRRGLRSWLRGAARVVWWRIRRRLRPRTRR